jgi:adenosylcobinamide-GDP ribazoletransferase
MLSFLFALQFLTIIPLKIKNFDSAKFSKAMLYFPIVGLLIGLILAGINNLFLFLGFNNFIISIILVVALIIITGGMHLDGLSDTFDAIASGKDKETMLSIMRDSHAGVMGILSIICVILLKISFLSSLSYAYKINALMVMCMLSRAAMVFIIFMFPYARSDGKGKIFSQGVNLKIFIVVIMLSLIFTLAFYGIKGLILIAVAYLTSFVFARFITRKVGGITGDSLGAAGELTETTVLAALALLGRGGL